MAEQQDWTFQSWPGSLAFTQDRLSRLKTNIGARAICAISVYYLDIHVQNDIRTKSVLEYLLPFPATYEQAYEDSNGTLPKRQEALDAGPLWQMLVDSIKSHENPQPHSGAMVYFTSPRSGTISPWSSQATAQAYVCGLNGTVRRIERGYAFAVAFENSALHWDGRNKLPSWLNLLFDRMTQQISVEKPRRETIFVEHSPAPLKTIAISDTEGNLSKDALVQANRELGLALDGAEIDYLIDAYVRLGRDPTDVELFMFAQVNSEHCRHKQFNADWTIDGMRKDKTLFDMIRNTHQESPKYTVSAYSDNAAVFQGLPASFWAPSQITGEWIQSKETVHYLGKVETHNHPTAVSPFPGAATGSGGEIRDEGAVGRGSSPKSGLAGFWVSDLLIPGSVQPWEKDVGRPEHITSSLDIMLEAPIGSANYNNEFGRPCTLGCFRTFLQEVSTGDKAEIKTELRGYHKPIMIAGGVGTVRPQHAIKEKGLVKSGAQLLVLGGPAMLIGLGGGAASSVQSGEGSVDLDFASVQRGNAEVQRRVQEVINKCTAMSTNPIQLIHDVGAGGLSNALPELVHDAGLGATFELRQIDNAEKGMSPLQIWCCEAQERYVVAVSEENLSTFLRIVQQERCGYSVVGKAAGDIGSGGKRLILYDQDAPNSTKPIDLPMSMLFGKAPKLSRIVNSRKLKFLSFDASLSTYLPKLPEKEILHTAINRVLSMPSVGSKSFLITIGDRTVGGLTTRDQMVGPWQVPVADVSVTAASLMPGIQGGFAMAMGEKPTLALKSPAASARMAVAESLMNIAAADVLDSLERVKLSANWMCASSHPGEGAALYEAVEAIGMELCPELGVSIPVGKDSMSMKMKWNDSESKDKEVIAPLSLIVTAFTPSRRISRTWTPTLQRLEDVGETLLLFVDLAQGMKALGGSALCQSFGKIGDEVPDIRDVELFKDFFDAIEQLHEAGIVLAYHDRSDGGLLTTLVEMMFAGRCGIDVMLDHVSPSVRAKDVLEALFNEELAAVFQVRKRDEIEFNRCFATCGPPPGMIKRVGRVCPVKKQSLSIWHGATLIYSESRSNLQQQWSWTSYQLQRLRDNASCADAEHENIVDDLDPGLRFNLTFNPKDNILPFTSSISAALTAKPRVAILREQGTNGQAEMALAFHVAGFSAHDVHMTDIISGRVSLASFVGLAACGGFSYGDVLGAGRGWASTVLYHDSVREEFETFFARPETFTLGVCNGCQFLSYLKNIIPGASSWPTFKQNISEQYEARVCMVEVIESPETTPSVFLHGMSGSRLPIITAHGEGRAFFASSSNSTAATLYEQGLVPIRYVDNKLVATERYPYNPNGSPLGISGVRSMDGRCLALMPHPERSILKEAASWLPRDQADTWGDFGPWVRIFKSARKWVG